MIFYNRKKKIKVGTGDEIASCMEFIEHSLNDLGTNKNLLLKTLLLAEECAAQIIEHADDGAFLSVKVRKALGDAQVVISALGREYDPYDHADLLGNGLSEEEEDDVSEAARAILLTVSSVCAASGRLASDAYRTSPARTLMQSPSPTTPCLTNSRAYTGMVAMILSVIFFSSESF